MIFGPRNPSLDRALVAYGLAEHRVPGSAQLARALPRDAEIAFAAPVGYVLAQSGRPDQSGAGVFAVTGDAQGWYAGPPNVLWSVPLGPVLSRLLQPRVFTLSWPWGDGPPDGGELRLRFSSESASAHFRRILVWAHRSWMQAQPGFRPNRPEAMPIRDPQEAENVAAVWMRWMGFIDASVTRGGADGGIDVDSRLAVAQVKARLTKTSRPEIQALHGAAAPLGKRGLFFAMTGYSGHAIEWANNLSMPLLRFDMEGGVAADNPPADRLLAGVDYAEIVEATGR